MRSSSARPGFARPGRPTVLGWAFVAVQFVLLAALLSELITSKRRGLLTSTAGFLVAGTGLTILGAASMKLGGKLRAHPAPPDGAMLHTDGLYSYVRHPIYSGLLLFSAGIALIARTPRATVSFLALTALLNAKARFEERLLTGRFPTYRAYADRTPRLIPRHRR